VRISHKASGIVGFLSLLGCLVVGPRGARADDPAVDQSPREVVGYDRQADVIYGRKSGLAMTMDVFIPRKGRNGAAVVLVVSGGYFSNHDAITPNLFRALLNRGYVVFAVVHGSQPQFTVPEIVSDVYRAIRFIRHHAADYAIDPNRIGATGASAGGHLSLMLGAAGADPRPNANDPVDRQPSKVNAVACFFPPTDFLNYGGPGRELIHVRDFEPMFRPAFEFREIDRTTNLWVTVSDDDRLRAISRAISPINFVTADDAPTLIYHGEADKLVPVQQSEAMIARLKAAGVDAKLVIKPKVGHGWITMPRDMEDFADWFDAHLPKKVAINNPDSHAVQSLSKEASR